MDVCFHCRAPAPLHQCSACRVARYCDAACQRAAWTEGHHFDLCSMLVGIPLAGKKRARDGVADDDEEEPVKKQARSVGQEIIDEMRDTPLLLDLPVELLYLILDPENLSVYLLMTRVAAVNTVLRGHVATLLARVFDHLIVRDLEMMRREHLVLRENWRYDTHLFSRAAVATRVYCLADALCEVDETARAARALADEHVGNGIAMFSAWADPRVAIDSYVSVWFDARRAARWVDADLLINPRIDNSFEYFDEGRLAPVLKTLFEHADTEQAFRAIRLTYPYAVIRVGLPFPDGRGLVEWMELGYSIPAARRPLHPTINHVPDEFFDHRVWPHRHDETTWPTSVPDARFPGRMKVHVSDEALAAAKRALIRQ